MNQEHQADHAAVVQQLRDGGRFLLVTHEHPDGDALGSVVAMQGLLKALGKDVQLFMDADEFPLPYEYAFFRLENLVSVLPADLASRTIVFLDCGNIDRTPSELLRTVDAHIVNIDHHHDNTRFGTANLIVDDASCTAEIVWELFGSLGVAVTPEVADALYVGLVTDTGRFMYENTGVRAHTMAAALIKAGVDVQGVYRRLYEGMPEPKLLLLARALAQVQRFDDGSITITQLTREDFLATGAEDSFTEGIIDHLRSVRGTRVAAMARELPVNGSGSRSKVSLRSVDGTVDVSQIARAGGGGGHRQAAGFTTIMSADELVAFLREHVSSQMPS